MRKHSITFLFILFSTTIQAQQVKYFETQKPEKESKKVNSIIIGNIDSLIYVLTTNEKKSTNPRLSVYKKDSFTVIKKRNINEMYKSDSTSLLKNAKYNDVIISDNNLYITWIIEDKAKSTLILQMFDKELNVIQQPKIIYQWNKTIKKRSNTHPFFLASPDGNLYIIGCEQKDVKSNSNLNYTLHHKMTSKVDTIQVSLPYSISIKTDDILSNFSMSNQGELFINARVQFIEDSLSNSSKTGFFVGSISSDSKLKYQIIAVKDKVIHNFKFEIFDDYLMAFGVYLANQIIGKDGEIDIEQLEIGVFCIKLDKKTFSMIDTIKVSPIEVDKIVFNDFKSQNKNSSSKDQYAINQLKKWDILFSDYCYLSDNSLIFTLNSKRNRLEFYKNGERRFTDFFGTYYIKMNKTGMIDWVSCIEQNMTLNDYVSLSHRMIEKDDNLYSIVQTKKKQATICSINEKTGFIIKNSIEKRFDKEFKEIIDHQLFFVRTSQRISTVGWIGIGTTISAMIASSIIFPFVIPLEAMIVWAFSRIKANNVYFGKYQFQTN